MKQVHNMKSETCAQNEQRFDAIAVYRSVIRTCCQKRNVQTEASNEYLVCAFFKQ